MRKLRRMALAGLSTMLLTCFLCSSAVAQEPALLTTEELAKVVPNNFYFEGQLGPTQMRNAAAVRFQEKRHLVAALVDTSGYASSIRSKYEGFLIMDAPVVVGGTALKVGAYGFGFTDDLKLNILDLGGNTIHTLAVKKDAEAKSPKPLNIVKAGAEYRLYRGRNYVVIAFK
jgi:hypothetical protein